MTTEPTPQALVAQARSEFYAQSKDKAQATAKQLTTLHRPSLWKAIKRKAKQAVSFVKAVLSPLWQKRLTNTQYADRLAQCLQCPHLEHGQPLGYCKACGCGRNKLAELTIKAHLPGSTCPEGKWDVGH